MLKGESKRLSYLKQYRDESGQEDNNNDNAK